MTAKRRAPIEGLATGERTLDAEAARYLARVLRLEAGDAFVAFDPKTAKEADARIVSIDHGIVTVAVGEVRSARVVAPREATVIQGLAKGEKCDAIVRDATELGATRIVFAETARSVVKLEGDRARERLLRWEKIAAEAARQSLRGDAPVIALASWSEAVATANADAARFVLDPAVRINVWDASAESRYMVLPRRPTGTENLDEQALAALVTRNGLIGVAPV